jgi:hypothetical protein
VVNAVIADPELGATDGHPRKPAAHQALIRTYDVRPPEVPGSVRMLLGQALVHYVW